MSYTFYQKRMESDKRKNALFSPLSREEFHKIFHRIGLRRGNFFLFAPCIANFPRLFGTQIAISSRFGGRIFRKKATRRLEDRSQFRERAGEGEVKNKGPANSEALKLTRQLSGQRVLELTPQAVRAW